MFRLPPLRRRLDSGALCPFQIIYPDYARDILGEYLGCFTCEVIVQCLFPADGEAKYGLLHS